MSHAFLTFEELVARELRAIRAEARANTIVLWAKLQQMETRFMTAHDDARQQVADVEAAMDAGFKALNDKIAELQAKIDGMATGEVFTTEEVTAMLVDIKAHIPTSPPVVA